jgi:hypothetical protein
MLKLAKGLVERKKKKRKKKKREMSRIFRMYILQVIAFLTTYVKCPSSCMALARRCSLIG